MAGSGGGGLPKLGLLGGEEGDFRDTLRRLGAVLMMMDPQTQNAGAAMMQLQDSRIDRREKKRKVNETAAWLGQQGVGAEEAAYLASNPTAMNSWYTAWKAGQKPDWKMQELYNDKGEKQMYMIDQNTGAMNPIGGHEIKKPTVTIETFTIDGKEQKVLFNHDTQEVVKTLGDPHDPDLISPQAVEQKKEIAGAGASKTTIDMKGAGKENETVGEGMGKDYLEMQKSGRSAVKTLGTLKLMENSLNDPNFQSGGGGDWLLKAKQWAKSLGWDAEGVTSMETFNALSKQMTLDALGGSLGAGISASDQKFITESMPGIGMTKGGNRAMIAIQRKLQERNIEIARMARDYRKATGKMDEGFYDELADFGEKNPVFTEQDVAAIQAMANEPDPVPQGGGDGAGAGGVVTPPKKLEPTVTDLQGNPVAPPAVPKSSNPKVQIEVIPAPQAQPARPVPIPAPVQAPMGGRVAPPGLRMPNPARF